MARTTRRPRVFLLVAVLVLVLASLALVYPQLVATPGPQPERGPGDVNLVRVNGNSTTLLWPYTSRRPDFNTLTLPVNVVFQADAPRVRSILLERRDARWNESAGEWEGVGGEDESAALDDRNVTWSRSHGATRYSYVHVPPGTKQPELRGLPAPTRGWIDETYQVHDGDYFGTRYHLRLYAGATGENGWTAVQAHYEYWDWFRLRHTVGSLAKGQQYVEREFFGRPFTDSVTRQRYGNGGIIDADGWVTVIDLNDSHRDVRVSNATKNTTGAVVVEENVTTTANESNATTTANENNVTTIANETNATNSTADGGNATTTFAANETSATNTTSDTTRLVPVALVSLAGLPFVARRLDGQSVRAVVRRVPRPGTTDVRYLALFGSQVVIVLFVRIGALAAEGMGYAGSPKVVAAAGYLLLALGLPACAAILAEDLPAEESAIVALVGLGTGILADYAMLVVTTIPVSVVVHRGILVSAIAVVAAGGSHRAATGDRRLLVAGIAFWIAALALPLLDAL